MTLPTLYMKGLWHGSVICPISEWVGPGGRKGLFLNFPRHRASDHLFDFFTASPKKVTQPHLLSILM